MSKNRNESPASSEAISQQQSSSLLLPLMDPTFTPPDYFPSLITDKYNDKVLTINSALSHSECLSIISLINSNPNIKTQFQKRTNEFTFRHNDRLQFFDQPFSDFLYERVKPLLQTHPSFTNSVGMNSNIRLYRYEKGMRFDAHYDENNKLDTGKTRWTVLCYLNTMPKNSGGETTFFVHNDESKVAVSIPCVEGSVCLHVHGVECLLHKGSEVTSGTKYLLRTDVVFSK